MKRVALGLLLALMASAPCRAAPMSQSELAKLPGDVATERLMDQFADLLAAGLSKLRFHHGDAAQRAELGKIATGDPHAKDITPDEARSLLPHRLILLNVPKPATFDGEADGQLAMDVEFVTHARAGAAQGVCTLYYLELSMSPQGRRIDPSIPLSAADFYLFKGFFHLKPSGRKATDARCRALAEGPQIVSPITGPDEAQALEGDRTRRELLREIEHGKTSFELDCSETEEKERSACLAALRKMLPQVSQIRGCSNHVCSMSHFGDFEDFIVVTTAAGRVRSVKVQSIHIVID